MKRSLKMCAAALFMVSMLSLASCNRWCGDSCDPCGWDSCGPCGPSDCGPCGPSSCSPCGPGGGSYGPAGGSCGPSSCAPCGQGGYDQGNAYPPKCDPCSPIPSCTPGCPTYTPNCPPAQCQPYAPSRCAGGRCQ